MKKRKKMQVPFGCEKPLFEGYEYPKNLIHAMNLRMNPLDRIDEAPTEERRGWLAEALSLLNGQEQMAIKLLYEMHLSFLKASEASGIELRTLINAERSAVWHLTLNDCWRLIAYGGRR